ncbi:MAG: Chaperone SurA [Alphaproteobacteria bacterium MarineAlpha9_Bin2]|nr:MAG: Chaperone SurA [Alphaproteobacteria bacterium MarineAlpha9_Bin2]
MYFKKYIFCIYLFFFIFINSINAETDNKEIDIISIVAVVNDEAITLTDLISRLDLVIMTSKLPNDYATRKNLSAQIIQTLINEKLQSQEANKLDIRASKLEINNFIAFIEKRNGMEPGTLFSILIQKGLSKNALVEQVKAQIIWEKLLKKVVAPRISVSGNEINNELNILLSNEGQNEYKYYEIYLNFSQDQQKQNIINTANQIREQIIESGNFSEIALQMSQSTTAKNGGLVSWTLENSIPRVVYEKIKSMSEKSISEAIITNTGVYIISLEEVRKFKIPNLSDSVLEFATVKFEIPAEKERIEKITIEIIKKTKNLTSCKEFSEIKKIDGSNYESSIRKNIINKLSVNLRESLSNLKPGIPSKPHVQTDGIYVIMLCYQNLEANQEYALKELVKNKLQERYFKMRSNRFILSLKRKALIDLRM